MELNKNLKKLIPLPVQELAKHLKKSDKSEKPRPRPRRLSNIYPVHSQTYRNIAQRARCAITPTGGSGAQSFFPPTCTPMTVNSVKGQTSSVSKMDMFVSSPAWNAPFATSPSSSIYDQDRSDLNTFCGNSALSNPSMDSEDMCGLDENIEDSSLETLLTPDVMSTLQTTVMNTSSDIPWAGKLETDASVPADSESLGPNPTLAQLNMEPDMSFVNDMLNLDQDDSKLSYSALDFLCNDINDVGSPSSFTSVSTSSSRVVPVVVSSPSDSKRRSETVGSSQINHRSFQDVGSSFIRNFPPLKPNFPPRASHPQLIGVVAPVIKPEADEPISSAKDDDGLMKLKNQSPNLHKLLSKQPQPESIVKSEVCSPSDCVAGKPMGANDCAQIVPSSSASKRTHTGIVKVEPTSPRSTARPLVKEESTEDKWKDIENFLHNPGKESSAKRRRCDSGSSGHMSDDDDDDDDDGSSSYGGKDRDDDSDDDYSDIDADLAHICPSECESLVATGKKQKQFFWQYNVQSKGPKGTRLKLTVDSPSDPHVLNDFEDPVFDECNTAIAGIRHGGKARKGDGNEITPNPRKLFMIGHQLMRLNRQINACQLGADVPVAKRNESRKEKNKLASRACRLKKKAQHEANKIKLYGLEQEHSQLNSVLRYIWPHIREKAKVILGQTDRSSLSSPSATLTNMLEGQINQNLKSMIAAHTTDYVNSVILKVESGDNSGGLNVRKSHRT